MMNAGDVFSISEQGDLLSRYKKRPFNSPGFSEKWLQKVIFENIELIKPTDPDYEKIRIIPLCREFSLNDGVRNLYLDILAVTDVDLHVQLTQFRCPLHRIFDPSPVISHAVLR